MTVVVVDAVGRLSYQLLVSVLSRWQETNIHPVGAASSSQPLDRGGGSFHVPFDTAEQRRCFSCRTSTTTFVPELAGHMLQREICTYVYNVGSRGG